MRIDPDGREMSKLTLYTPPWWSSLQPQGDMCASGVRGHAAPDGPCKLRGIWLSDVLSLYSLWYDLSNIHISPLRQLSNVIEAINTIYNNLLEHSNSIKNAAFARRRWNVFSTRLRSLVQQWEKHHVIIETHCTQMDGKRSPLTCSINRLCVFLVKLYAQEKKAQVHCWAAVPILHGLIWSMVSMSPRPRWDLRSHQAHTFERHLFIFRMQMQPTSKAISCGEHTMWMCWSALPGGWGPTYVRFRFSPHPEPQRPHTNTSL